MNKRFKLSGFDERIIGHGKNIINAGNQFFQVDIRPIGKNADAVIVSRNHEDHRPESAVGPRMINGLRGSFPLADKPSIAIPKFLRSIDFRLSLPGPSDHGGIGKNA